MSFRETDAIVVHGVSKSYRRYDRPFDRLRELLHLGRSRRGSHEFQALQEISFNVRKGEVLGVVGRNGAGKSTLLQLICGTLTPSSGSIEVNGRIAALLELGAGFNPDFTGRENVYFNATLLGLRRDEIDARLEAIIAFSGIGDFIDQPVKTYSSGMFVRLAFSVAVSVSPDILIIDEALSVGDGAFARQSFDRIMALKEQGKTILFCSHSLYQVEAICDRVAWLNQGRIEAIGVPGEVISAYNRYLDSLRLPDNAAGVETPAPQERLARHGVARIKSVTVSVDGVAGKELRAVSGASDISVTVAFESDPALPPPVIASGFETDHGQLVTSVLSNADQFIARRDASGHGCVSVHFPACALLKGRYWAGVVLMCEDGIHFYDSALRVASVEISRADLLQGFVALPHHWADGNEA